MKKFTCKVCGKVLGDFSRIHLKTHDMSIEGYLARFPEDEKVAYSSMCEAHICFARGKPEVKPDEADYLDYMRGRFRKK